MKRYVFFFRSSLAMLFGFDWVLLDFTDDTSAKTKMIFSRLFSTCAFCNWQIDVENRSLRLCYKDAFDTQYSNDLYQNRKKLLFHNKHIYI